MNANAYVTQSLYKTGHSAAISRTIVFDQPTISLAAADPDRSANVLVRPMGLSVGGLYTSAETPSASSPGSTVPITGDYSLVYVTDSDISTLTLPNIIDTTEPNAGEVAIGFTLTIVINSATTVAINTHASDSIITKDLSGTSTTISAVTGNTRIYELVAVGTSTWARKL